MGVRFAGVDSSAWLGRLRDRHGERQERGRRGESSCLEVRLPSVRTSGVRYSTLLYGGMSEERIRPSKWRVRRKDSLEGVEGASPGMSQLENNRS